MATGFRRRPLRELTLRHGAVTALAVGVLALVGMVLATNLDGVQGAYEGADKAESLRLTNQEFALAMADAQDVLGDYLVTGSALLAPRTAARLRRADEVRDRLRSAEPDHRVAAALAAGASWRSWAERGKVMIDTGQRSAADPAELELGRSLYADFRAADADYDELLAGRAGQAKALARQRRAGQSTFITFAALIAAASLLTLAAMVTGWILTPLRRLAQLARRVAGGDYGRVPYERRGDELGDLARALGAWQRGDRERGELTRRVALSEARLKLIFDRAPVGICRIGLDGGILDANPALLEIFGYAHHELVGRQLADLTNAEDLKGNRRLYRQMESSSAADGASLTFERRYFRQDGSQFWGTLAVSAVPGEDSKPDHFIGMIDNISARKAREDALETRALHDQLTGLPNRGLLTDRLDQAIAEARRHGTGFTLVLLDLDGFKAVNDSRGHQAGDEVLIQVAGRLRDVTRAADTVARLGGDEFVVVLPEAGTRPAADTAGRKLLAVFDTSFQLADGHPAAIGASLGCALYPADSDSVRGLLLQADRAMYLAKQSGSRLAFADMRSAAEASAAAD